MNVEKELTELMKHADKIIDKYKNEEEEQTGKGLSREEFDCFVGLLERLEKHDIKRVVFVFHNDVDDKPWRIDIHKN